MFGSPSNGLKVIVILAVMGVLACGQTQEEPVPAPAKPPIKLAEGKYGAQNSWTLWASPDGLRAEIQLYWAPDVAKGGRQKEILDLAPDFTMRSFRYEVEYLPSLGTGALECAKREKSFECTSTLGGAKGRGRGSLPFTGAFATQFGVEMAFLDMPWFYTTLVAESDRNAAQPRQVGIVTIAFDGKTPDTLITGNGNTAVVKYMGKETIRVLARQVSGQKFQVSTRHYNATVWTAESGLLLAADWAGMRMELTEYKQYVHLVPELGEKESPATPEPPAPRKNH